MERPSRPSQEALIEASLMCRHVYYVTDFQPHKQTIIKLSFAQLNSKTQFKHQSCNNCDETIVDALFKSLA